jgi:outer membrane protein assembly factor BamB
MREPDFRGVSTVAVLTIAILIGTALSGCRSTDLPATPGPHTVNDTFVDVSGLWQAPTKVSLSYPTQKSGYNGLQHANVPSLLDGILFTESQEPEDNNEVRTTAWDQMTGKKTWSFLGQGILDERSAYDANNLFYGNLTSRDRATGSVKWSSVLPNSETVLYNLESAILPDTSEKKPVANRLYGVVAAAQNGVQTHVPDIESYSGIYTWNASDGTFVDYIKYPTLSDNFGPLVSLLYDDGTIYADLPVSTPQDKSVITTADGAEATYTDVVAIDIETQKIRLIRSFPGRPGKLVEQDGYLVLLRDMNKPGALAGSTIDVLPLGVQQNELVSRSFDDGTNWTSIAVDNNHIYAASDKGALVAFKFPSLAVAWRLQFAEDVGTKKYSFPSPKLVATRNVLYAYATGGLVFATDPATGKELWRRSIQEVVRPLFSLDYLWLFRAVDDGFLVVMSDEVVSICH